MKTLREYIDLVNTLDQKRPVQEGAIGAAIGGGLGGVAGSALGPLGIVGGAAAGAALGSKAGDLMSKLFNHKDDDTDFDDGPVNQDSNSPTGYVTGSGQVVQPPAGGLKPQPSRSPGDSDANGVPDGGYKSYSPSIFSVKTALPTGGDYGEKIKRAMAIRSSWLGQSIKVLGTWDYKGASVAVAEYDAPRKHWVDTSELGGTGDTREDWEPLGYKFLGSKRFDTSNKFGNCIGNAEHYKAGIMGSDIMVIETTQLVAFSQPTGTPGMHYLKSVFCGPSQVWKSGGLNALQDLVNSIDLKGVEQLKSAT